MKEYSDMRITVGLLLFDAYEDQEIGPELRIRCFDKTNNCYNTVTAFRAIVGETMYSFEALAEYTNWGYAFSCTTLESFCTALITGKTIAFQIHYTDKFGSGWTATIDPVKLEDMQDLIAMAKLLKESGAWTISPYGEINDAIYSASIE